MFKLSFTRVKEKESYLRITKLEINGKDIQHLFIKEYKVLLKRRKH